MRSLVAELLVEASSKPVLHKHTNRSIAPDKMKRLSLEKARQLTLLSWPENFLTKDSDATSHSRIDIDAESR